MRLEFHQLERRWEHLRVRGPHPCDSGHMWCNPQTRHDRVVAAQLYERLIVDQFLPDGFRVATSGESLLDPLAPRFARA
jgi:hypothetical protein